MERKLQVLGAFNELGDFEFTHVYITSKVAKLKENKHLKLKAGYMEMQGEPSGCNPKCPSDTLLGYYDCISNKCVFFPYS